MDFVVQRVIIQIFVAQKVFVLVDSFVLMVPTVVPVVVPMGGLELGPVEVHRVVIIQSLVVQILARDQCRSLVVL